MSSAMPQLCIDGQWIACLQAEGYGTLGVRYLCDLGTGQGRLAKRLLIRHRAWPQARGTGREVLAKLTAGKVPDGRQLRLRPVMPNKYQQTSPQTDGSTRIDVCPVLQQDVTGLISLKQAILRALKSSQPQQVWQLFYHACKVLDDFGKAVGVERPVPLQCPESLAVDANNRVVPLDAEILVAGSPPADGEASRLYRTWFGEVGSKGFADPQTASVMHANALLLYFRKVLGDWQQHASECNRPLPAVVTTPLQRTRAGASLEDFKNWIRESAEDWNIPIDDEDNEQAPPLKETPPEPVASTVLPRKKPSLLLRLSLCLNLLLIGTLAILLLLWPRQSGAVSPSKIANQKELEAATATGDCALFFSSYCVVFPTQGTISEKVGAALQELFPDQFREMKRHAPDHDKLLQEKMEESIKSIREPDKIKRLLARLATDHAIRFKGFTASDPNQSLTAVIERGGIFTMAAASREQHGSLLQTNGLEKILDQVGLRDDREAHELLNSLKKAIAEYASLKDALSIIGDRTA